jgi:hypothetical protein
VLLSAPAQALIQEMVSTYATTAATMSPNVVSSNTLTQAVDAAQQLIPSRQGQVPTQQLAALALLLLPGSLHAHMQGLLALLFVNGSVRSTCVGTCMRPTLEIRPA